MLTDVARLETGHTPSRKHPEYWGGDVPWIGIRDATGNHGGTLYKTLQYTNELGIRNSSARILPANTVCLSRTASVGYVVVMGTPMATSQDFVNWVCGPMLDHRFLKYVLLGERGSFLRFASGTTHQTIYFPEVKAFHIALPPLETQRGIADVLGSLDDRIDLLRQTNATLESIAQALYKSWFIDFDPVRAKAEGREPEGMDAETAVLFPVSFEDSTLGQVPKGWAVGVVDDLLVLQRGFDLPAQQREEGPYPVLAASGPSGSHSQSMGSAPGVTTGRSGVIGNVYFVQRDFWPLNTSLWVKQFKVATPAYAYQLLKTLDLKRLNAGSAVPTLNRNHVHAQPALLPAREVVERYTETANVLLARIGENEIHEDSLVELRNTLLPHLISGKLRLPEAEAQVNEALA
ncbi:restriction endonuclease subunit S [Paraburkholderia sp. 35.1]|uniref:restriction endonuclease subunit S n=1 Tax=Paraburkholderia sp. 35.1 TaxID=2991058 RepID=UPI003D1CF9D4